jgi:hypothetical protein
LVAPHGLYIKLILLDSFYIRLLFYFISLKVYLSIILSFITFLSSLTLFFDEESKEFIADSLLAFWIFFLKASAMIGRDCLEVKLIIEKKIRFRL